jgi:hypothetical protein
VRADSSKYHLDGLKPPASPNTFSLS